jgi:hypothetical protein
MTIDNAESITNRGYQARIERALALLDNACKFANVLNVCRQILIAEPPLERTVGNA